MIEGSSSRSELKDILDTLVIQYERTEFIAEDPISFPHAFDDPRDQEVIGLFAAILAWGRRSIMLNKLEDLLGRMDYQPHRFVVGFAENRDGPKLADFKHRTFQPVDAVAMVQSLQTVLKNFGSLENLASSFMDKEVSHIGPAIQGVSDTLSTIIPGTPPRINKHLPRPSTGSACKRLAMFFRWMVRSGPVDLGIWNNIPSSKLVLPLDVHTGRQARKFGLLSRKQNDWKATLELTKTCRSFSAEDPARYDLALFGLGAYQGRVISTT